jgi:hypothetical protein
MGYGCLLEGTRAISLGVVGRRNWIGLSCGQVINMMETSEHGYCDELSSLRASIRRRCRRRAGRALSNGTVWAPAVEVADILGQDFLQMALVEDEHVVQALGPDRPHPALGNRVGPRRSERRAHLGKTEITHPPIEAGAIAAVAVMNEETWRLAVPTATFDNLLCRPRGGRMRRHVHVQNLPAGVMDHEEHVQCSKT